MIDVATLKNYMGLVSDTEDATLTRMIDAVTKAMETYCGQHFVQTAITNESHEGTGQETLLLRYAPASAVSAITIDGEALAAADYALDSELAQITFDEAPELGAVILVSYTCGYAATNYPADLVEALLMQCTWRYRQLRHNLIGMRSVAMADNAGSTVYTGLPWLVEVQQTLDGYRRILF